MRPAVRLAALMELPVTYVWTHDSIGLGEDGPTHQPVEHLAALRAIPGLDVVRPGDANETSVAWRTDAGAHRPAGRAVPDPAEPAGPGPLGGHGPGQRGGHRPGRLRAGRGGRRRAGGDPHRAPAARCRSRWRHGTCSQDEGISTRVVSMPCVEWFTAQDASYQEEVLPPRVRARVSVEAGIALPWHAFVGDFGEMRQPGALRGIRRLHEAVRGVRVHRGARGRSRPIQPGPAGRRSGRERERGFMTAEQQTP